MLRRMGSESWRTPEFWRSLCPGLHAGDIGGTEDNRVVVSARQLEDAKQQFLEEGYCSFEGVDWGLDFLALRACFETLRAHQWPPVFVFVYDEFWQLISRMAWLVGELLGGEPKRLPDIWAWHLEPALAETGWEPHRDKGCKTLFEDGSPKSITYWLPVTEALPLNGCIYLLPKNKDPHYNTEKEMRPNVPLTEIRALPSAPGTLWFWNQAVLHWSGRAHPSALSPRLSVSCEYQRADVPPYKEPLTDPSKAPPFSGRLALIARQLIQYRHMTPLTPEVEAWLFSKAGADD